MKFLIRSFFKTVRFVAGPVVLFLDWVTTPRGIDRPSGQQVLVDQQTQNLVLYQFKTCPFCIRVRRTMTRLSLDIEKRDAQFNQQHRNDLLQGGGVIKVPCLKITADDGQVTWLYESHTIITHLQTQFGTGNGEI